MKQILLIFHTELEVRYALIPKDEFYDEEGCPIDLKEINGHDVTEESYSRQNKEIIRRLFTRTGIAGQERIDIEKDLKQYLDPKFPITIDEICWIGWSI